MNRCLVLTDGTGAGGYREQPTTDASGLVSKDAQEHPRLTAWMSLFSPALAAAPFGRERVRDFGLGPGQLAIDGCPVAAVIARSSMSDSKPTADLLQTRHILHQVGFTVQVRLQRARRGMPRTRNASRRSGPAGKDGEGPGRVALLRRRVGPGAPAEKAPTWSRRGQGSRCISLTALVFPQVRSPHPAHLPDAGAARPKRRDDRIATPGLRGAED